MYKRLKDIKTLELFIEWVSGGEGKEEVKHWLFVYEVEGSYRYHYRVKHHHVTRKVQIH